jgi:hypothetical protein
MQNYALLYWKKAIKAIVSYPFDILMTIKLIGNVHVHVTCSGYPLSLNWKPGYEM